MQQCRLGIQPIAEPGRGDQTYDVPPYGHITKIKEIIPFTLVVEEELDIIVTQ